MFRNLFSSKNKTKNNKNTAIGKAGLISRRDGTIEKKVMEGAERELYQYEQPKQELGMSELLKAHENDTRFMYAAITGREPEELSAKLRRLTTFQPILRKKAIHIDNLPTIKLYKEIESFPLDSVLPKGKAKNHGDYVRVSDALSMYGAIVSPDCHFTKVKIGITDNRLLTGNLVKSYSATSNIAARGNLALPYCVPIEDIDQLILTVSRERSFIAEGRQWGALQIQLVLEFMAFPMQFENQTVVAQNMLPPSALETPLVDPNHVDISILNNNRDGLHQLFLSGDLVDETEPIADKMEAVKYAKSSMRLGQKKGKAIPVSSKDWTFVQDGRKSIPADQNSNDPSQDGSFHAPSIKSLDDWEPGPSVEYDDDVIKPMKSAMRSNTPPPKKRNISFGDSTTIMSEPTNSPPRSKTNDIDKLTPW